MDPFALFGAYPTARLGPDTLLGLAGATRHVRDLGGGCDTAILVSANLPERAVMDAILARIAAGPLKLWDLVNAFPDQDRRMLVSAVAWLLKFGLADRL